MVHLYTLEIGLKQEKICTPLQCRAGNLLRKDAEKKVRSNQIAPDVDRRNWEAQRVLCINVKASKVQIIV